MKKILPILCFLVWMATDLKAQSNIVAAGGDASGTGGSVSYSAGQVDYSTKSGTGGVITEGVHQPFEISVVSGIEENSIDLKAIVYPNPTSDFVELHISDATDASLSYELIDIHGKIISKTPITALVTEIDMASLPNGSYFLKVSDRKRLIKTFQIKKYQ